MSAGGKKRGLAKCYSNDEFRKGVTNDLTGDGITAEQLTSDITEPCYALLDVKRTVYGSEFIATFSSTSASQASPSSLVSSLSAKLASGTSSLGTGSVTAVSATAVQGAVAVPGAITASAGLSTGAIAGIAVAGVVALTAAVVVAVVVVKKSGGDGSNNNPPRPTTVVDDEGNETTVQVDVPVSILWIIYVLVILFINFSYYRLLIRERADQRLVSI